MDEARRVLDRLDRIDELERGGAPPGRMLEEVRALLAEAEVWVRVEAEPGRATEALERAREALDAPPGARLGQGRTLVA